MLHVNRYCCAGHSETRALSQNTFISPSTGKTMIIVHCTLTVRVQIHYTQTYMWIALSDYDYVYEHFGSHHYIHCTSLVNCLVSICIHTHTSIPVYSYTAYIIAIVEHLHRSIVITVNAYISIHNYKPSKFYMYCRPHVQRSTY